MQLPNIDSIQQQYEHVYVSPHLDDVVLSCAGRILQQKNQGETVLIVTAFTGDTQKAWSHLHLKSHNLPNMEQRRAEERRAMDYLGVDHLLLGYPEVLFRSDAPAIFSSSCTHVRRRDIVLCEELLRNIRTVCQVAQVRILYLPLAVGNHADHQIIFKLGEHFLSHCELPLKLVYYEDVPYVFVPHLINYRLKRLRGRAWAENLSETEARLSDTPVLREIVELYYGLTALPTVESQTSLRKGLLFLVVAFRALSAAMMPGFGPSGCTGRKLSPEICDVSAEAEEKAEAIRQYRSQVPLLFRENEPLMDIYSQYSQNLGAAPGQFLERYWRVIERPYT